MKNGVMLHPYLPITATSLTTATFFCPQKVAVVEWFNCKLKYKTNIISIEKKIQI